MEINGKLSVCTGSYDRDDKPVQAIDREGLSLKRLISHELNEKDRKSEREINWETQLNPNDSSKDRAQNAQ